MREIIKQILQEEVRKDVLQKSIQDNGFAFTARMVGGYDNLVKILYNGDIMEFYNITGFEPVRITEDGMNMYIDDLIILSFDIPVNIRGRNEEEVLLGDFKWRSTGYDYKFTARARAFISQRNGQKLWRVVGTSGDYGFGYAFIPTKQILGKRARRQIFNQIIEKYDLQKYL
jgi:hypothetical protein